LAEKTGKKVFVGQSSRFFEPIKRQRADFEQGLIGELVTIETHYNADHRWFLGRAGRLANVLSGCFGGLSIRSTYPLVHARIEEVMGYGMLSQRQGWRIEARRHHAIHHESKRWP
jgi:predicted dehydrogenase